MSLAGGIFGALIGSLVAGPIGALIGGVLGSILTGNSKSGGENYVPDWADMLFMCLGKLAKSDGRVSEDEAAFVRSFLKSMRWDQPTNQRMIRMFNAGRDSQASFAELVTRLTNQLPMNQQGIELRYNITEIFCSLVAADRIADPNEIAMLRQTGRILHSEHVVDNFFAKSGYSSNRTNSSSNSSAETSLEGCYRVLGIAPTATDQEVKRAFRKLAVTCHPDKIQGAGLSNEHIQQAKIKFQKISDAYDTICKHRGIK